MSSLPAVNENLPPGKDWIDEQGSFYGNEVGTVELQGNRRWMLLRSSEVVMWGEGQVLIDFDKMRQVGHDPSYELRYGEAVGTVPKDSFAISTPEGYQCGEIDGTVSHKMAANESPDVRAT